MLDGVFERRNNCLDVRRQLAMTLDVRPERDWRRKDQRTIQTNRVEIVVKVWPSTAMKRVARPSYTGSTILPMAGSSDVRTAFIGQKHVGAPIEALRVALQSPRSYRHWSQVGIVGDHDEHIDVLRIWFRRDDRAQDGNALHARQVSD